MLLGIDIGTSSVKVSVVDEQTQQCIASASYPDTEAKIISLRSGWAEQSPEDWWEFTRKALGRLQAGGRYVPQDITAIGIAYQMHGLVLVDKEQNTIRNSIIWCDSRAVDYGEAAFEKIGKGQCLSCLLNSPGNFTAAKLAWVKEHEPEVYKRIDKLMLPGDYVAMKLTGEITTSISALSEGIFWDFKENRVSESLIEYFGFDYSIFPRVKNVFDEHGRVTAQASNELNLKKGTPVTYKAGDQPNNAFSLNVLEPGEVAANAGTSGVIYGVTDELAYDQHSRINSFAHVNHTTSHKRIGVLLCINGAGITSSWLRQLEGKTKDYNEYNRLAAAIPPGSDGLFFLPFGNGAERILNNKIIGAEIKGVDFNKHTSAHLYRSGLEGVACAFRYGLDIMQQNGIQPTVIRAGNANMFLSEIFLETFVNVTGVPVELYNNDGSCGAALGAGVGAGVFNQEEAFRELQPIRRVEARDSQTYNALYEGWKEMLMQKLDQD